MEIANEIEEIYNMLGAVSVMDIEPLSEHELKEISEKVLGLINIPADLSETHATHLATHLAHFMDEYDADCIASLIIACSESKEDTFFFDFIKRVYKTNDEDLLNCVIMSDARLNYHKAFGHPITQMYMKFGIRSMLKLIYNYYNEEYSLIFTMQDDYCPDVRCVAECMVRDGELAELEEELNKICPFLDTDLFMQEMMDNIE